MTLVFENDLVAPTLTLAVAYFLLSINACRKLMSLHENAPEMNTRKLFVMTCLLTTVMRSMAFGSMTVFNYAEFHLKVRTDILPTNDDAVVTDAFFEKATLVLLNVPDWCCISAYVLLIVVCAEALLQSRRHWLSAFEFRKTWILGYLIFNALLYTVQLLLYSLLFMPSVNQEILTALIYLTLTFFNLGLPVVLLLGFIFLSVRFSGFPYSSICAQKRLTSLVRLGRIWTLARLFWGFIALTSVMQSWLVSAQKTVQYYSFILISVYFFAEILPIGISLQNDYLDSLTDKPGVADGMHQCITPIWNCEEKILTRDPPYSSPSEYCSIHTGDTKNPSNGLKPDRAVQITNRGVRDASYAYKEKWKDGVPLDDRERRNSSGSGKVSYQRGDRSSNKSNGNGTGLEGGEGHDVSVVNEKPSLQQGYFSLPSLECSRSDSSFVTPSDGHCSSNQQSIASDLNSHDYGEESDTLEEWEESSFGSGIGRLLYNPDRRWANWIGY